MVTTTAGDSARVTGNSDPFQSIGAGGSSAASGGANSRRDDSASGRNEEAKVGETVGASEHTLVTFSPEEQYAHVTLSYMIDNVCLHEAKQDEIRQQYLEKI